MTFHVVIERPRDAGPGAASTLATAMAHRYGIPVDQLRERLAAGSLRVKSNVDLATAEAFARDLESIGAVCAILDATTGEPIPAAKPAPKPAPAPTPAPTPAPVARPAPNPSSSPLAGIAAPARPSGSHSPFSSGLAAASEAPAAQDLGALITGRFSLATLDGADDQDASAPVPQASSSASFMPASFGPAEPAAAELHSGPPVDPFAPPDASQEAVLDLDVDPATIRRPGQMSTAPIPLAAAPGASSTMAATAEPEPAAPPRKPGLAGLAADRRVRLGAGVALAILIGFLPAHLVAAVREDSAYAQVDKEIQARYKSVLTEADWDALDPMLARQVEHKKDQRRSIALASFLIWGLVGGAVAFVWFRKLDWDAIVTRLEA